MKVKTINDHLDRKYGEKGSETRDDFDEKARAFMIAEMLKAVRKKVRNG